MNEELVKKITELVAKELSESTALSDKRGIPVGVSARHVHLTREHLDTLFGQGYELKKKKALMGGQFAAEETVTLIGAKLGAMERVRILGPLRSSTQVELSLTDGLKLGTKVPVRNSGDIKGSCPITIVGPKGAVTINEGCIAAKRHIHMSPEDAEFYKVKDGDIVSVMIPGDRGGIMGNVLIRVNKSFTLEMHIDTDEANAFGVNSGDAVHIA
jgi:putative phosphotransacetylase